MVDETPPVIETPYVRIATLEDVEGIVDVMCQAFKHDPVLNYLSNAPKLLDETSDPKHHNHRRIFLRFLLKASFLVDGRITVVVDPNASSANEGAPRERIVAAAYWLPPNKRLAVWMIPTIVRAGALAVVKVWGLKPKLLFQRMIFDYQETSHGQLHHAFKRKGTKKSIDDTWYLQMVGTDPEYQGRGLMSLLFREAYTHDPKSTYTLEATTSKSRDQYAHLGFEDCISINFGRGKADAQGLTAKGEKAVGLEIYGMIKVGTYFFFTISSSHRHHYNSIVVTRSTTIAPGKHRSASL
ncbi:hypothetical protein BDN70DRAFT_818299 [Pholiota conissans]|uniref:N-acetyltransferase domain-containing protein n=1 Tax=Pholiota conissans TaxID=109636 RepID=A0A9P5YRN0_9AGAR|nr:hypothetical protein BDN70DRAFT_818299 [Pholiota conissans]